MAKTYSYAAQNAKDALKPFTFERRAPGADDVQIDILYCGVCHSDLHTVRNEWNNTLYPSVPGHEIVGRVTAVGGNVSKFKVGDLAGVSPSSHISAGRARPPRCRASRIWSPTRSPDR